MSARVIGVGVWLLCGLQATGDGASSGQLPVIERLVHAVPAELGGAFRAGMAELEADLGFGLGVDEGDDAGPGRGSVRVRTRCPGSRG